MSITVIDQGPELYWFVSNALVVDEIPLRHIQTIITGEKIIFKELPEIVIINGDDKALRPIELIIKMKNNVFTRNIKFIVFTSDTSHEFKESLILAGAAQVLYRGRGFSPSPKFFAGLIKWFLNHKDPDPQIFDYQPAPFPTEAEFTSFGRLGWISSTQCMIETDLNIPAGHIINFNCPLFEELEIKNAQLECVEINKVGRYYQHANSLLCNIRSKDHEGDKKKLKSWIDNNQDISKHKDVKIVYFESDPSSQNEIKNMIKSEKHYCARGYSNLDNLSETLQFELPHLILVNRSLIQKDKMKFDVLKNFLNANFSYCITYSDDKILDAEEFKKDYDFALHTNTFINLPLLESMIKKLEEKLPKDLKTDKKKVYLNKNSPYSRIKLSTPCHLIELALNGAGVILPFSISNFCECEITCHPFSVAEMNHSQFFRAFNGKQKANGYYHRLVFMGQNVKDNENVKKATSLIQKYGYDQWLIGDPLKIIP